MTESPYGLFRVARPPHVRRAMTEPLERAQRVRTVLPGLAHFTVHDDRVDGRSDAYALITRQGTVLVDPLPLAEKALASLGNVVAIVISIQSHQRSSWRYRERFGARVFAPKGAVDLEEEPDVFYEDGDELPGRLVAWRAPGPAFESYVLLRKRHRGGHLTFVGDLLIRERSGALAFVPDVYMDDPEAARASVERLATLPIGVLCSGHGAPLLAGVIGVRNAILRTLARDAKRHETFGTAGPPMPG